MQAQELESGSWGRTRAAPPPSVFSLSLGVPGSAGGRSARSTFSFEVQGEEEGEFVGEGEEDQTSLPDAQHTRRRILGMSGTMGGGSDSSAYHPDAPLDVDDEDSDVPGELREILKEHENELRHERSMEIPVFRASLTDHSEYPVKTTMDPSPSPFPSPAPSSHSLSLPSPTTTSEDDTKQSFDFTGELRKLNESGASDRRSFVEQLENAFRTPARVDLRYGFEVPPPPPPLPDMPLGMMKLAGAFELSDGGATSGDGEAFDDGGVSRIVDVQLPSWSSASASAMEVTNPNEAHLDTNTTDSDSLQLGALGQSKSRSRLVDVQEPSGLLSASTSSSNSSNSTRPSDGELDRSFRFGGLPKASEEAQQEKEKAPERELTLSDIIPPPAHARSISLAAGALDASVSRHGQHHQTTASDPSADLDSEALEDDSVLKSIYAKILEGLPPAVPRPKRVDPGVANSGVAKVCVPLVEFYVVVNGG
jgi:serine/arginine repetitive matrix protein 2